MAENNPEYQKLISILQNSIGKLQLNPKEKILELGSGTGNFTLILSKIFKKNVISTMESNPEMIKISEEKFTRGKASNINQSHGDYHDLLIQEKNISLIVAIHSIYCSNRHELLLNRIYDSLKPGGLFFTIDLGRKMDVSDWRRYIFNHLRRKKGILKSIGIFIKGLPVISSNKKIRTHQNSGEYWVHSPEEFANKITNSGFNIKKYGKCYRDYSDWVLASKPI